LQEPSTRSTAELVMDVADDVRMLVRKELELARIELMEGLKAQVIGAGVILFALLALLPGFLMGLIALALWLPFSRDLSFAIVAGGLAGVALLGTLIGIRIMKRRRPRLDRSVASIKEDVRWAREQLTS
jgi:uncharacterized membrane protein YqjE